MRYYLCGKCESCVGSSSGPNAKPSRETIHDFERRPGRAWSWNEDVSFCGDVAQWCVFVPLCLCSGNPLVLVLDVTKETVNEVTSN
jgi:hypothetical protein